MVLPADTDELEKLLQSTIDLDKFLAFVSYGAVRDDRAGRRRRRASTSRTRTCERTTAPIQVETLVHELAHAAGAPLAGPFVSNWVHEGVADWIATGRSTRERSRRVGRRLPRDFEFSTGCQSEIIQAYRESRSATSYLSSRQGLGAPTALFRESGSVRVAPGNADHQIDAALRRATGGALGLADLQAGWARR